MTEIATLSGGLEMRDRYLDTAPPGSTLFHAQLYPYIYPPDEQRRAALRDQGRPISELVVPEYMDFVERTVRRGVRLCRLVVTLGKGDEGYNPDRLKEHQDVFAGIQSLGEEIRITTYGRQIIRLQDACGADSDLVKKYKNGVEQRTARASFWSIHTATPDALQDVNAIALMHYSDDGERMSVPVHVPPFGDEVRKYEAFWRGVFHDTVESSPL